MTVEEDPRSHVELLLELRAAIEWDWPDGPGRDTALQAVDELLRAAGGSPADAS